MIKSKSAARGLLLQEWRLLAFGMLMTLCSSPGQTFFISLFSGQIRADLGLSHAAFGSIYSVATLGSALLLIGSGTLVDRVELRKFAVAVLLLLALGCWLLSVSQAVLMLGLSLLLLRHAGQGLMFLCSTTAMVRYLEAVKGKATALSGMGYSLGEALLPSGVVVLLAWFGWRTSWQLGAGIILVCIVPTVLLLLRGQAQRDMRYRRQIESAKVEVGTPRRRQWRRAEVLRDLKFYLFLPGLLSQPFLYTGFIFHQIHLVETKGWLLSMWGGLFVVYALVSVGFNLLCGILIDRYGASRIVPYFPLPMALGLLALTLSSHPSAALVFLVMTGVTVGLSSPLATPFFVELYGSQHIGAIKSLSTAAMVLFSSISPVVLGWLFDYGVAVETLAASGAIYIVLTSILAGYTRRRYLHDAAG